jgi:hypothetical protein
MGLRPVIARVVAEARRTQIFSLSLRLLRRDAEHFLIIDARRLFLP